MDRYNRYKPSIFGFPKKEKAIGLMKVGYVFFCDAGTQSLGRIYHINHLFEPNFGTIRRKNGHFNLLQFCDCVPNLRSRLIDFKYKVTAIY